MVEEDRVRNVAQDSPNQTKPSKNNTHNKDKSSDIYDNGGTSEENGNTVTTVIVNNIANAPVSQKKVFKGVELFDPDALDIIGGEIEKNVMKDESVTYKNTHKLPKKTQNIYDNLPPIVDSININKVSQNMMKVPNKVLSKRLARLQAGHGDEDYGDY